MRLLLNAFVFLSFCTGASAMTVQGPVQNLLRVATEGFYEPYNFCRDSKGQTKTCEYPEELVGFDIDMAKEVCKELGRVCVFSLHNWGDLVEGRGLGQSYDVIVASLGMSPERLKYMDFVGPYDPNTKNANVSLVAHKGKDGDISCAGLAGSKLALQGGSLHETYIKNLAGECSGGFDFSRDVVVLDTVPEVLDSLLNGKVEFALLDKGASKPFRVANPDYVLVGRSIVYGTGSFIALPYFQPNLKWRIDVALANIFVSGRYKALQKKWNLK